MRPTLREACKLLARLVHDAGCLNSVFASALVYCVLKALGKVLAPSQIVTALKVCVFALFDYLLTAIRLYSYE